MSTGRPAGVASGKTTSARPCDSPAVRKRTIRAPIVYEVSARPAAAPRGFPRKLPRRGRGGALALRHHMPQMLADRFVSPGGAWIDLATGDAVRIHVARAGPARDQLAWNARCAALANLRHPLINPLIDYGLAGRDRTFEAYAVHGAVRAGGVAGQTLLAHAARFLRAHDVALTRPLADLVLRQVTHGPTRRVVPIGIVLQRRAAFDAIVEVLEAAHPAGPCAIVIAGETDTGLRTL